MTDKPNIKERTLVLLKPDALQRGIVSDIIGRFERKGLKIVGMKVLKLSDAMLNEHYVQHKGKSFFVPTKKFMMMLPVVALAFEGLEVVQVVRAMCGPTNGRTAPQGTIRGDYSMAISRNIVHSSEDVKAAKRELGIFFKPTELVSYQRADEHFFYSEEEGLK